MRDYTESRGTERLMQVSGINEEALEMVAKQAAMAVDELVDGNWPPYLVLQIFMHAFFMTVHLQNLDKHLIEQLINEQFTLVSEGVKRHIQEHGGLGPLIGQVEGQEPGAPLVLPPRFKH